MAEVGKVKIELNQAINKLETERSSQSDLRDKLASADKELSGKFILYSYEQLFFFLFPQVTVFSTYIIE